MTVKELILELNRVSTSSLSLPVVLSVEGVGRFEIVEAQEDDDEFVLKISQTDEAELLKEPDFYNPQIEESCGCGWQH